jgi:hypothetical protein
MIKHGEYVAPHIAMLELEDSPPNTVNANTLNGVIVRFDKRIPVSLNPSAFNNIGGLFRNALYIKSSGASIQLRGVALLFCIIAVAPFFAFSDQIIRLASHDLLKSSIYGCIFLVVSGYLVLFLYPRWIWAYLRKV